MTAARIFAICIALLGVILAGRALLPTSRATHHPQTPAPTPSGDPEAADESRHPPSLPEWDALSFSSARADDAIASLSAALDEDARWVQVDLPNDARSDLRERFLRRVSYVLRASEDDRLAAALAERATRTDAPDGLSPESIERCGRWPQVWADAPIDASNIRVRILDVSSGAAMRAASTPAVTSSPLSAAYGEPAQPKRLYEIIVPIRPRTAPDESRRIPAFLGVAYERTAQNTWRPHRISVYTHEHPGGRPLIAPPM
ncbi:MAG: hypothetical protein AB7G17_10230 [Phycisphaerales bacterium]